MIDLEQRAAGVLLHVTSLPGPHGIGDFGPDAYRFVDWLQSAGQRVWQWLPTNPIGPGNSPYQSVSAFAGSPLMVALEPLIAASWLPAPTLPDGGFDARTVDFGGVIAWRHAQLRSAHAGFLAKQNPEEHRAFAHWAGQQSGWLDDYTLFMALETAHHGATWWRWPAPLRERDAGALAAARTQHANEIGFWTFVQWCFDTQSHALKRYANDRGVAIMGDLPIFIAHHSADCWSRPDLYMLDSDYQPTSVAGCPPDAMAPTGQRWGNPLYRWGAHAREGYAWWVQRVRRTFELVDVVRIDHFRGFADYWEIPASEPTAIKGRWLPGPGAALFEAIRAQLGDLPIIAEDLGLLTPEVTTLRRQFDLPGMRILHFAFGGKNDNSYLPHNFDANTVVYTGTHDNNTSQGWWLEASDADRQHVRDYLGLTPQDELEIHWQLITAACASVADTAIHPMQDVLGLDGSSRMNLPGVGEGYWEWRFKWDQVKPVHGQRLVRLSALYRR